MDEKVKLYKSLRELDPQALSSVHREMYPDVVRFAAYRVNDPMVAEDLASETFIRLIDALKRGKGPTRNLRGWLMGTVNNLINDHFRRTYKQEEHLRSEPDSQVVDPASQIDLDLDTHHQLATALRTLTDEQQMVISLRFGADMSLNETAAVMGKNANAIKALQFRAIAALRRELERISDDR